MMAVEIEKVARQAGFELADAEHPSRLVFTRGKYTLVVNADATWSCHITLSGGRKPNCFGYTFDSLLAFLTLEFVQSGEFRSQNSKNSRS